MPSAAEARLHRLAASGLLERAPAERLPDVAAAVAGVQAQAFSAALVAIGMRVEGGRREDVEAELWTRRGLVRTYGPRGTIHLLAAEELPVWMTALRTLYADTDEERELVAAIADALDGRCLSREELADAVAARRGAALRERLLSAWGELLRPAAFAGRLCFGPPRGARVTFVRADQWLGAWTEVDGDEAVKTVTRRYLRAYGPASSAEVARWFAISPARARALIAGLGTELEEVRVDGRRLWALPDAAPPTPAGEQTVRLVPQYDPYVLGTPPAERFASERARARVFGFGRGRFEGPVALPVLLVGGLVAGIWRFRARAEQVRVDVEPCVPLTRSQRAELAAEAARAAAFLGGELELRIGTLD